MSAPDPKSSSSKYELSDEQKEWLSDFYSAFKSHIAPRGTTRQPNAKAWVTFTLTPSFMTEYHSGLVGLEATETSTKAAKAIYIYYSNRLKADPERERGDKEEEARVNAENLWAKDNTSLVKDAVTEYLKEQPDTTKVAAHRSVVCQLFKELPPDQQAHWKALAQTEREVQALGAKQQLTGDNKKVYTDKFLLRVSQLFKEGELKAGIYSHADIAAEKPKELELAGDDSGGSILLINSVFSPGVQGFKDTNEHRDAANQFGEYLREHLNKMVVDKSPPPAVIPGKDGFPEVPANYDEQALRDNRAMVRTSMRAHWQIAGGQGAVPWKEIAKSIEAGQEDWVDHNRLPKGARFADPCELSLDECRSWLKHLSLRQDQTSDESRHFQFGQVYACAKHEFPDYAQVVSREKVRRANHDVQLVRLKGYYRKPNTFEAIKYPDSTWKYVRYLRSLTRLAPTPVIDKKETSVYLGWFRGLETDDADVFNLVRELITATNKLERYAPLAAENELWFDPDGEPLKLPQVLPQSPPVEHDVEVFTRRYWAPRSLFGPVDGVEEQGTFACFGRWQHSQRDGPLFDPATKTYRGGKLGIAWNTRGLLKVMANMGAALGKIEPPTEAPADYNLGGPRIEDWNLSVQWLREWRDLLETAATNLSNIVPDKMRSAALASLPKAIPPKPRKRAAPKTKRSSQSSDGESDIDKDAGSHGSSPPAKRMKRTKRPKQVSPSDLLLVPDRGQVNFDTRVSIFGPVPEASPVQRFNGTLQELSSAISTCIARCRHLITRYNEATPETDVHDSNLLTQIRTRIHDKDSGVRSLLESVLKQRGNWLRAETLWKTVEPLYREGRQIMKEAVILQRAIDAGCQGRDGPVVDRVTRQQGELLAYFWATKCIVRRFSKFFLLSLRWANHLKDEWESISISATAEDLVALVASIRDWYQDYRTLLEHRTQEEKEGWAEYDLKRYSVPDLNECWYAFGCPVDGALSSLATDLVKDVSKAKSFLEIEKEEGPVGAQESNEDKDSSGDATQAADVPIPSSESVAHEPAQSRNKPTASKVGDAAAAKSFVPDKPLMHGADADKQELVNKTSLAPGGGLACEPKQGEDDERAASNPSIVEMDTPTNKETLTVQPTSLDNGVTKHGTSNVIESEPEHEHEHEHEPGEEKKVTSSNGLGRGRGRGGGRGGRGQGRGKGRGVGSSSRVYAGSKEQEGLASPTALSSSGAAEVDGSASVQTRPKRNRVVPAKFRNN